MQNQTNRDAGKPRASAHSEKPNVNIGKTIFNFVIALILTLVVTVSFLCISLEKTLFNADYAVKIIEKYDIDGATERNIENELKIQLQNSGVDGEFIKSLIPGNISEQFKNNIMALYGKSEIDKENADYKTYLNEKFWKEIEKQSGGTVDRTNQETQAAVDNNVDIVLTVYNNNMTLPFDADEIVSPYINKFAKTFSTASGLTVGAALLLMAILVALNANKKKSFGIPYMATSFCASAIIFIVLYALLNISGCIKNISMPNEADTLLVKAVNDGTSKMLLIAFAISILIFAAFLAADILIRKPKDKAARAKVGAGAQRGNAAYRSNSSQDSMSRSARPTSSGQAKAPSRSRPDIDDDEPVFETRPRKKQ